MSELLDGPNVRRNIIEMASVRFDRGWGVAPVWDRSKQARAPREIPNRGYAAFPGTRLLLPVERVGWGLWKEVPED